MVQNNELTPEGQHRAELCLIVWVDQDEVLDVQDSADVLPHPTVHWYACEAALQHPCITLSFYQRVGILVVNNKAWGDFSGETARIAGLHTHLIYRQHGGKVQP